MGVASQVQEFLLPMSGRTEEADERDREPSQLYRCRSCSVTYISMGMDSCPKCNTGVSTIPSERDLGFV